MKTIESKQLAGMNMHYQRYSFQCFLDSVERIGIKNFELWAGAPHFCNLFNSLFNVKYVKREVRKRGLNIVCVTPEQVLYPYNIAAADSDLRKASIEYFLSYIRATAELEADKLLCCSGWGNYDEDREEAWKRAVDALETMCIEAQKNNVVLAFEILGPQETNLVYSLETTKRMMDEISSTAFKLCVDTVPIRVDGHTLETFFEAFGDRIVHVHLTDGKPEGHMVYGDGDHSLTQHLDALSRFDYSGYITLEIADFGTYVQPEESMRRGYQYVKRHMPYRMNSK